MPSPSSYKRLTLGEFGDLRVDKLFDLEAALRALHEPCLDEHPALIIASAPSPWHITSPTMTQETEKTNKHSLKRVRDNRTGNRRAIRWVRDRREPRTDVRRGVPELSLDERDVRVRARGGRIERAHVPGERCEERRERGRGRARGVRGDQPGRPGRGHGADLRWGARGGMSGNQSSRTRGRRWRTKRHSPASTKGLVVNHSHMKALVEPSFTEATSPCISLFTNIGGIIICAYLSRAC